MLRSKLEGRGLNNTRISVLGMEPCVIKDHRLAFNLRGFPPVEPGMGGIEPSAGCDCHAALVKLTRAEYEKVWLSEGGGREKPGYSEIVVNARRYGSEELIQAVALRASEHVRLERDAAPSARYMKILIEGATELGLTAEYLEKLRNVATANPSQLTRALFTSHLTLTGLLFRYKLKAVNDIIMKLLWAVYASPGSSSPSRLVASDLLSALILFPGALLGFFIAKISKLFGIALPNPFGNVLKTPAKTT